MKIILRAAPLALLAFGASETHACESSPPTKDHPLPLASPKCNALRWAAVGNSPDAHFQHDVASGDHTKPLLIFPRGAKQIHIDIDVGCELQSGVDEAPSPQPGWSFSAAYPGSRSRSAPPPQGLAPLAPLIAEASRAASASERLAEVFESLGRSQDATASLRIGAEASVSASAYRRGGETIFSGSIARAD